MTEIEKKALALVNEVQRDFGLDRLTKLDLNLTGNEALCRAIEQHEAYKQEVSDAVVDYCGYVPPDSPSHPITRFIIAKPDPLEEAVEALREMLGAVCGETGFAHAVRAESGLAYPWPALDLAEAKARAALAARGLEVRKIGEGE